MSFSDEYRSGPRKTSSVSGFRTGSLREGVNQQSISQKIRQLSINVTLIRQLCDQMGGPKDSLENRQKMHHTIEETRELIRNITLDIKSFETKREDDPFEEKNAKVQRQKLMKDFQNWLNEFQEVAKYSGIVEKDHPSPPTPQGGFGISQGFYSSSQSAYEDPSERQRLIEEQNKQMQIQNEAEFNQAIIRDREQGIKEVEKAVQEVHEIFVDLSNLVVEQGVFIDNIESNVDSAHNNVSSGVQEIKKASEYQKKSRTKLCCLLLLLVILGAAAFAIIWIFFK